MLGGRSYSLAAAIAAAALAAPAAAQNVGGIASENVEWISNLAETAGVSEGGRLVGRTFFMTSNAQGLLVLDAAEADKPKVIARLAVPHLLENEDIPTNGRILLITQAGTVYNTYPDSSTQAPTKLHVIDVRDPSAPREIATVDGGGDHTWECLLDCTWAYGAGGLIMDLRDPTHPKLMTENWRDLDQESTDGAGIGFPHDLTEVAPGLLLVAADPFGLIDAREDPLHPKLLAVAEDAGNSNHNASWPNGGTDRYVITSSENPNAGRCEINEVLPAGLGTWNARGWEQTKSFEPFATYFPMNGTLTDGEPPVSATWYGCSAHWAEVHPTFRDGGLLAAAFYSHGARLLDVGEGGALTEKGYFIGHGGAASAVYWITDRIMWVVDLNRGLDVIRYTGELPARPATAPPPVAPPSKQAPLRDRLSPELRITRAQISRRGVATLRIRCNEDCYGRATLSTVRRPRRLAARRVAVAGGKTAQVTLRVRARLLRHARRGVVVQAVVTDRAGNRATARRRVRPR